MYISSLGIESSKSRQFANNMISCRNSSKWAQLWKSHLFVQSMYDNNGHLVLPAGTKQSWWKSSWRRRGTSVSSSLLSCFIYYYCLFPYQWISRSMSIIATFILPWRIQKYWLHLLKGLRFFWNISSAFLGLFFLPLTMHDSTLKFRSYCVFRLVRPFESVL